MLWFSALSANRDCERFWQWWYYYCWHAYARPAQRTLAQGVKNSYLGVLVVRRNLARKLNPNGTSTHNQDVRGALQLLDRVCPRADHVLDAVAFDFGGRDACGTCRDNELRAHMCSLTRNWKCCRNMNWNESWNLRYKGVCCGNVLHNRKGLTWTRPQEPLSWQDRWMWPRHALFVPWEAGCPTFGNDMLATQSRRSNIYALQGGPWGSMQVKGTYVRDENRFVIVRAVGRPCGANLVKACLSFLDLWSEIKSESNSLLHSDQWMCYSHVTVSLLQLVADVRLNSPSAYLDSFSPRSLGNYPGWSWRMLLQQGLRQSPQPSHHSGTSCSLLPSSSFVHDLTVFSPATKRVALQAFVPGQDCGARGASPTELQTQTDSDSVL